MLRTNNIPNTSKQANNEEFKMFLPDNLFSTDTTPSKNIFEKYVQRQLQQRKKYQ